MLIANAECGLAFYLPPLLVIGNFYKSGLFVFDPYSLSLIILCNATKQITRADSTHDSWELII